MLFSAEIDQSTQIPTHRVAPRNSQCDIWCEYPVADRPAAIKGFLETAVKNTSMITAPWVLVLEADYAWKKPFKVSIAVY